MIFALKGEGFNFTTPGMIAQSRLVACMPLQNQTLAKNSEGNEVDSPRTQGMHPLDFAQ